MLGKPSINRQKICHFVLPYLTLKRGVTLTIVMVSESVRSIG
jgi:hypothetical protein